MTDLKNKVVLITGGARGLGESLCKELSNMGAVVIAVDIQEKLLETTIGQLKEEGANIEGRTVDLRDEQEIRELFTYITGKYKRLDVLVNNAAVDLTVPIDDLTVEDFDRIVQVNLRAPFILSKYALPLMKNQQSGNIINISSTAAKRAWPNASAYHATKWGLLGFSHALFTEASKFNIKVTAVISGGMKTPFLLDRFPDINTDTLQDPGNVAKVIKFILTVPSDCVIPEIMVLPIKETSWP